MSQPVKLSDTLVLDARVAGEAFQRSIAGQVESHGSARPHSHTRPPASADGLTARQSSPHSGCN
ncbi:MAG: hypothetical protein COZ06_16555 [Armatimonadetes bacterium CG_4_10_14_3_um_filter_66_18]|nr:MAG: hypothetical protein COZ57_10520 [Armatimonadetes bacterium CG_4_8_14_3_um_filter_66_20]PIY48426.1 MAG: hypothetical protein COZ06_16555 [Armatimonadetes bacterium CG_4_10_14_3_um_filter_66_18]